MDRFALYVNDAAHAAPMIAALLVGGADRACTVVLCPPRLSHHAGRFLSDRQRRQWRTTWSDRAQGELLSLLPASAVSQLNWATADHPLHRTAGRLRRQQGAGLRLLDLRRSAAGATPAALEAPPVGRQQARWGAPAAVATSVAAVLALVD